MKKMPNSIKQKLKRYDSYLRKAKELHDELALDFERYGVPYGNLVGNADYPLEATTESFAFVSYCEGYIEENIQDIEEVFLHFVNKKRK